MVKHIFDKNKMDQYIQQRITRDFIDILILSELAQAPLSGYDLISIIYRKFNLMISPGTIYSTLYTLERRGLIKGGEHHHRRRVYILTRKGEEFMRSILSMRENIGLLLSKILGVNVQLKG